MVAFTRGNKEIAIALEMKSAILGKQETYFELDKVFLKGNIKENLGDSVKRNVNWNTHKEVKGNIQGNIKEFSIPPKVYLTQEKVDYTKWENYLSIEYWVDGCKKALSLNSK